MYRRVSLLLVCALPSLVSCKESADSTEKMVPEPSGSQEGMTGSGGSKSGPAIPATTGSGGSGSTGSGGTTGAAGAKSTEPNSGTGGKTTSSAGSEDAGVPVTDASPRDTVRREASALVDAPPLPTTGVPAPPCKYAFCESFETYVDGMPIPKGTWSSESSKVTASSKIAARGKMALNIRDLTTGQYFIRTNKPPATLLNNHFGRMLMWIEQEPQMKAPVYHWTAAELSERLQGGAFVIRTVGGLATGPGANPLFFNIEPHDGNGETGRTDFQARLAPKTWHCLEWSFNQAQSQYKLWWNGKERTGMAWPDPAKPDDPKYTGERYKFREMKAFSVGMASYQAPDVPWDVYIDEVVLHSERVGCD